MKEAFPIIDSHFRILFSIICGKDHYNRSRAKESCMQKEKADMEEESDTGRIVKQKGGCDEKINIQEGHNLRGRQKSRLCFFIPFFRKGMNYIKGQPPGRIIAMGFAFVILTGSFLLMLPCSVREGAQVSLSLIHI